jgi:predicted nucleic acid-binding Zn ribbon protein
MLGRAKAYKALIKMGILKKHICEECGTKFRRIELLMQHLQVWHGTGTSYECKQCNSKVDGMEAMRNHVKKFHTYNKAKDK